MALPEAEPQIGSDADLDGALARAVVAAGSRGATLEELWRAGIDIEPELASAPDRRHRLRGALDRSVDSGVVRGFPAGGALMTTARFLHYHSSCGRFLGPARRSPGGAAIGPAAKTGRRARSDRIRADEVATLRS